MAIFGPLAYSVFTRVLGQFWLWKWFLSPQDVPRVPKCIFRELSSSLTKSEIFVKNWTFLGTACPHFVPSCLGKKSIFGPFGIQREYCFLAIFQLKSVFWVSKRSQKSKKIFLESSWVVLPILKILLKNGFFFPTLGPTLYLTALEKSPYIGSLGVYGTFPQGNEVQSGVKCWEEKIIFWQNFQNW